MQKKHSLISLAIIALFVVSVAALSVHFLLASSVHAQKAVSASRPYPALDASHAAALASEVNAIIAENPGIDVAASVIDLNSNQSYQYGITDAFEAASTAKLITAADYLHHVQDGSASLDDDINGNVARQDLEQMIVVSDDNAWYDLNDYLGHPDLLAYATSIGMSGYDPDDNTMPASDIALLLQKLYEGKLLNKANSSLLLGYMAQANYQGYIGAVVPGDVKFYHKAGVLADRIHDAAIIDDGKHPLVLTIFTKDEDDEYEASPAQTQIIQQIATDVLSAYAIK